MRIVSTVLCSLGLTLMAPAAHGAENSRTEAVTRAPNHLAAELESRSRTTRIRDSSMEALIRHERVEEAGRAKAGFEGLREGDMDPGLQVNAGEPGVVRWFIDYGGRGPISRAFAVSQTVSGSLLMAGQVGAPGSGALPTRIGIVQLLPTGFADPALNGTGIQAFDISNPDLEVVAGFALTEVLHGIFWDRVYLLARDFNLSGGQRFALICFRRIQNTTTYEPCPGFANGIRYYGLGLAGACATDDSVPAGILLDRSDPPRIVLLGQTRRTFNACQDLDWAIIKVDLNGALDTGFAGDGQLAYYVPEGASPHVSMARSAAIRMAGSSLVVGGSAGTGAGERAILAQFNSDGTLDGGFCATGLESCASPPEHRNGRRSWTSGGTGRVTAMAPTTGDGVYVARRVGADAASQHFGTLSRIEPNGGCGTLCNEASMVPGISDRFTPVGVSWAFRNDVNPPGFRITVAGWARDSSSSDEGGTAYVYRFRDASGSLVPDAEFVTRADVPQRQDITWPTVAQTTPRDAEVFAVNLDRQGRVLVAGGVRVVGNERDMALARLQGKVVLFRNGFE